MIPLETPVDAGENGSVDGWRMHANGAAQDVDFSPEAIVRASVRCRERVHILRADDTGAIGVSFAEHAPVLRGESSLVASLEPVYPEWLGSSEFTETHGVRFPYVSGAMAHGIASPRLVLAMARAELLSFYGSAGLAPDTVEATVVELQRELGGAASWGSDLIHTPHDPSIEETLVDIYLRRDVRRVSASAFMRLTPAVVRYACTGLSAAPDGRILRKNHLFAKLSRPETAKLFMSPAPADIASALVQRGALSAQEAALAAHLPLAEDITVEADSGGHTDNRPLTALIPAITSLRAELQKTHRYPRSIRIGAAGGVGTPGAVAAAFGMGAAYVMTGSVNQSTVEAGTSDLAKEMLAVAELTDVAMAPSPDMFEMGVKVQVLKRGTMFASRATTLRELYRTYAGLHEIPADTVARIEREIFQRPLGDVWSETSRFFQERAPREVERAEKDPKHKMALVFRWYIGLGSHWAIEGVPSRKMDYQIWCGPAMGAFNRWVAGTFLADLKQRSVVQVALNLLEGAAVISRAQQLRSIGLRVPDVAFEYTPQLLH
jgi:trans-AT polyketide synthase/acyltransferase/oxidoreductase domain-containing protein